MLLLDNCKISLVQVTHALHHPDSSHEAMLNVLLIFTQNVLYTLHTYDISLNNCSKDTYIKFNITKDTIDCLFHDSPVKINSPHWLKARFL